MNKRKSTIRSNWSKYLLQWGVLAALVFFLSGLAGKLFPSMEPADPEKYCPLGGLQAFGTYLSRGSLPCSMTSMQILMGLALAAAVVLFSKLFCSYLCPVGSIEDLLKKARSVFGLKGFNPKDGSVLDKVLRFFKYGLLFYIAYMTISSSELFCKNLDPYYAVATGFKGEITLWMSIVTVSLVLLAGIVVDRFWCRYLCPLGAISNTLKFWIWLVGLVGVWCVVRLLGADISWVWFLGAFCLMGYLLEILHGRPRLQVLGVVIDNSKCNHGCYSCRKSCPYNIEVPACNGKVTSVDCMLCGECVAACPTGALSIGTTAGKTPRNHKFTRFLPAILTLVFVGLGFAIGSNVELPTIDEQWGVTEDMQLQSVTIENLRSVKCFSSSMAFKARMEKVPGVHGVKTFVGSHTVVVSYDPAVTTAEKVEAEVFVPSHFRVSSPDPKQYSEVKCVVIRTEHMYDKTDLNYLGLQLRLTDKKIFGLESQYDCPLIVRVYMAPEEEADEEWFREVVEKKSLDMPLHGGGVKQTPVDFEFVRLEKGSSTLGISEYLHNMFDGFKAEYLGQYPSGDTTVIRKRTEVYKDRAQFVYEVSDQNYEKPVIKRVLPYLSNHLSRNEGVIGMYLELNDSLVPSIKIRFAAPMTEDKLWELMTMDTWTITYSKEDVREENARIKFPHEGICYSYTPKEDKK